MFPIKFISVILILNIFFSGCDYKKKLDTKNDKKISSTLVGKDDRTLKLEVISGDTASYKKLRQLYYKMGNEIDFLAWAMLMSNKHHFEDAYYDVFFCVQSINMYNADYSTNTKSYKNILDSFTQNLSKQYLLRLSNREVINRNLAIYFNDSLR